MTENSTVFAGLDLGDRYIHFHVVDEAGEEVASGRFPGSLVGLQRWSEGYPGARVAVETGSHTRWVSQALTERGHDVVVANARKLRAISQNTRKDDATDAELLARLLRSDPSLLSPVQGVLERDTIALSTVRSRAALVEGRTALINFVRGTAKSYGIPLRRCDADNFGRLRHEMPDELQAVLAPLMDVIDAYTVQIAELDRTIEQISDEAYPVTRLLRTIPGVGPITALYFVLVVANPERFEERRDVGAYLGLVPRRDQSGAVDKQLRITKTGDTYLRRLLVVAAHSMLGPWGKDCALRQWGLAKAAGGKSAKKRAVVGVARKLAVLMLRLMVTKEEFRAWPDGEPQLELVREPIASATA